MPIIATRSLIPLLAMNSSSCCRWVPLRLALGARLPKIVVDPVGSKEPAKGHFNFVANRDLVGLAIGHLTHETSAALVIDHHVNGRRVEREREPIDRIGGNPSSAIGKWIRLHLIKRLAFDAYPLRRQLRCTASKTLGADQAEFPLLR